MIKIFQDCWSVNVERAYNEWRRIHPEYAITDNKVLMDTGEFTVVVFYEEDSDERCN